MPDELLVRGGRVVDATGERTADVRVRDGLVVDVGEQVSTGLVTRSIKETVVGDRIESHRGY